MQQDRSKSGDKDFTAEVVSPLGKLKKSDLAQHKGDKQKKRSQPNRHVSEATHARPAVMKHFCQKEKKHALAQVRLLVFSLVDVGQLFKEP
jgi:hypothetical protein